MVSYTLSHGALLQKAPSLELCWKMTGYDTGIINSVSPLQCTPALM